MIDRNEIDQHSKDMGVNVANVQRDYVFGWVLAGLYSASHLGEQLILKGGNCFRKAYFPLGRFSNDLDFSCAHRMPEDQLREGLSSVAAFATDRSGIEFDVGRTWIKESERAEAGRSVVKARLYFRDFYGKPSEIAISVRLDIAEFDRMHLEAVKMPLIHQYSDARLCSATVTCWQLEELLAAKLKCLVQRQHLVDLYDLIHSIFINRDVEVNRAQVASVFLRKTIFSKSPGAARSLLLELPLEFAKVAWQKYVVCPVQSMFDFETAEQQLRAFVESLFAEYTTARGELAFYPPAMRSKIMTAGREQTLMRITYDGSTRTIEPYALNYKVRSDGVGQEYLFAYDRTGGSSGPGMKTFLHGKIAALENLEEKFEPRYEVELSKAGEYPKQVTFADPNRVSTSRTRSTKRSRSPWAMTYTVQCPYCGKRFRRDRPTTRLNPHKNAWGSKCVGRIGFFV